MLIEERKRNAPRPAAGWSTPANAACAKNALRLKKQEADLQNREAHIRAGLQKGRSDTAIVLDTATRLEAKRVAACERVKATRLTRSTAEQEVQDQADLAACKRREEKCNDDVRLTRLKQGSVYAAARVEATRLTRIASEKKVTEETAARAEAARLAQQKLAESTRSA